MPASWPLAIHFPEAEELQEGGSYRNNDVNTIDGKIDGEVVDTTGATRIHDQMKTRQESIIEIHYGAPQGRRKTGKMPKKNHIELEGNQDHFKTCPLCPEAL